MLIVEHDIEYYLKSRVESAGGRCLKFPAVYEEGIPDRLVILPHNQIAFVEVKRPRGGKLEPIQEYQIGKLRKLGCKVYVLKNYKEVDNFMREMTKVIGEEESNASDREDGCVRMDSCDQGNEKPEEQLGE